METLDLPTIDASALAEAAQAPAAPQREVAVAAAATLDLAKVDLTDVALAQFGKWREHVAGVKKNLTTLALDLSTQSKVDEAKSLRQRLINQPRADVRKVSKELKSKLAKVSKAIGTEEEAAVLEYDEAEKLISPQIDARQQALDAEKEAARVAEANRKAAHQAGIARIRSYIEMAKGLPSERVAKGIAALEAMTFGPEWEEFAVQAASAQCETIEALKAMHTQVLAAEEEAAERERQRLENARVAAELAEQKRKLDEQAAALRRQAEELEAAKRASAQKALEESAAAEASAVRASAAINEALAAGVDLSDSLQDAAKAVIAGIHADSAILKASISITPDAQESGSVPETSGPCASSEAQAAQASPSGEVGAAAHAEERAAAPLFEFDLGPIETSEADAVEPAGWDGKFTITGATLVIPSEALLRECLELTKYAAAPFFGKFPSHPKTTPEWWAGLREQIEALQPKLNAALGEQQ